MNGGACDGGALWLERVMADEAVGSEAQVRDKLDEEVTAVRVDRPEHGHDTFRHFIII